MRGFVDPAPRRVVRVGDECSPAERLRARLQVAWSWEGPDHPCEADAPLSRVTARELCGNRPSASQARDRIDRHRDGSENGDADCA
jgi:hypothetical protein